MKETEPQVILIGRPSLDWPAIRQYLTAIGGEAWVDRVEGEAPTGEALVEFAGRLCYRSWEPGLNSNVTKIRTNRRSYLRNLLASAHGSVLEHAQYTFVFNDVSRVFTHELVRHRAGVAISQESLRFVRLTSLGFRIPAVLEPIRKDIVQMVETLEDFQGSAATKLGLSESSLPFEVKKELTSALRRLAPLGLSTTVVWSANIRTLRHVIEMRTALGAEEEMRLVFGRVGRVMAEECPLLFQDYTQDNAGQWVTDFRKV